MTKNPPSMMALRASGVLLVVVGLVMSVVPTLVHDPGPAPDLFEAVERHTRWGLPIGIGALLVGRTQLRPWSVTFAAVVLSVTVGYLVARTIGIALEGAGSSRQWLYYCVEVVIALVAAAYLRRRLDRKPEAES